ncbi:hypothetical protein R83H12_01494 [Fibrobacteria bacterium R8-3-H12]
MTDQELKDLVASLAVKDEESEQLRKESEQLTERIKLLLEETAALQKENELELKKSSEEFDRRIQENDRLLKESREEHDRMMKDLKDFAEDRVEMFREFFREFDDYDVYLGIAGFSFSDEVLDRASDYGIGIVKQVGEGVEIKADNLRAY